MNRCNRAPARARLWVWLGTLSLLCHVNPLWAGATQKDLGRVAGWHLVHMKDEIPDNSSCMALSKNRGQSLLLVKFGTQSIWGLDLSQSGQPGLEKGVMYSAKIRFDKGQPWRLTALGKKDGVSLRPDPAFIEAMAQAKQLTLALNTGLEISFPLKGNAKIVQALNDCHQHWVMAGKKPENPALNQLNQQVVQQVQQSHLDQALPLANQSLTLTRQQLGEHHPLYATSLINLAEIHKGQGQYAKAEPLLQQALAIQQKKLAPQDPQIAISLNNLAELYRLQARYDEAEPLYLKALEIDQKKYGKAHIEITTALNNLALLYQAEGRFSEAEPLLLKAQSILTKALGNQHPRVADIFNSLALLYQDQGRLGEAESLLQQALTIRERALGGDHLKVAYSLNNLAVLYDQQGRLPLAEPLYLKALALWKKHLGPEHPNLAATLNNLGALYTLEKRYQEAETVYQEALTIRKKSLGEGHPEVAKSLSNLAFLYQEQGQFKQAEPLYQSALTTWQKALGAGHPDVAIALNNLAGVYRDRHQYQQAEALYQKALKIREKLGQEHPDLAASLYNLAKLRIAQGRQAEARSLHHRVLAIDAQRQQKGLAGKKSKTQQRDHALAYLPLLSRLPTHTSEDNADALAAMQLARSTPGAEAFQSLAERLATGGDQRLAQWVRQRQDLQGQIDALEKRLLNTFGYQGESKTEMLLQKIDQQRQALEQLSQKLQQAFPAFTEFEGNRLAKLEQLHSALKPKEAALAWILGDNESYLLLLTHRDPPRLHRLNVGHDQIGRSVRQLHNALDLGDSSHQGRLAPFPAARSAQLFTQLFGPDWEHDLAGIDQLILVPEGPLTRLPFATLLTETPQKAMFSPQDSAYEKAPWLTRRFAISVLPTLSSLTALRSAKAPTAAPKPFLGIGDPLLDDHPAKVRGSGVAKRAPSSSLYRNTRGLGRIPQQLEKKTNLSQARLELIRQQPSLPDTADELQGIAALLQPNQIPALMLRQEATETRIKLNFLDSYRIISFATHGLLAGELGKGIEPGLILTPPKTATADDDGFLSLSEVAQLKLNADWVILSACNTAGGETNGAESLTGLAKAFIYAGSKSLLASHWSVSSESTVDLMGRLFHNYQQQGLSPAKAHQQAMLGMIQSGNPLSTHPSFWAPFVILGDGGKPEAVLGVE